MKYALLPCTGKKSFGILRGHLYKISDSEGNELGFATKDLAFKVYGEANCHISESDTICRICAAILNEELKVNLIPIKPQK